MIKIERTITIHRTMEEVFAYLSDVEQGHQYISGQRAARKTSAGPTGVGTTFVTTSKVLRRGTSNEVTEFEPNHRLAWKDARTTTTWSLEPSGPSTRVTFTRVAGAPALFGRAMPLVEQLSNGRVDHDLGTLKELLAVTRKPTSASRGW
jgi:uncharacterized protein YndB with AHSA1/START domain